VASEEKPTVIRDNPATNLGAARFFTCEIRGSNQ
jgi:hypothetical protein